MSTLTIALPTIPANVSGDQGALHFLAQNTRFNRPAITAAIAEWMAVRGTRDLYLLCDRIRHNTNVMTGRGSVQYSNYQATLNACSNELYNGRAVDLQTTRSFQRYWMSAVWTAIVSYQDNLVRNQAAEIVRLRNLLEAQAPIVEAARLEHEAVMNGSNDDIDEAQLNTAEAYDNYSNSLV